jgi:hypothetical protein
VSLQGLKRPGAYFAGAVLVATLMRFVAYAAATSYAAIFRVNVDARKIADHAQNTTGALAIVVVLILLSTHH